MKITSSPNTNSVSSDERSKKVLEPGFGKYYTDNMVIAQWSEATGWSDAKLQAYGPLTLDPATMVFHYGQEVFEGMKAYAQPDGGISLFRPEANAKRFAKSAARIALPEMPVDFFVQTVEALVKADKEWVPKKVGIDAARYTLIRYPTDTPMVMDVDLLKKNTNDNPVYYVQYAHARICAVLRNAKDFGIAYGVNFYNPELLVHEQERELIGFLAQYPRIVASAAQMRQPHRVARFIEDLAAQYHRFYNDCRVLPLGEEKPTQLNSARATLSLAAAQVISNGLELLGVSAPERM